MIVECKKCGSNFDVDDVMLMPAGRKLKCSSCKSIFFQPPPSEEDKAAAKAKNEALPPEEEEEEEESQEEDESEAETVLNPKTAASSAEEEEAAPEEEEEEAAPEEEEDEEEEEEGEEEEDEEEEDEEEEDEEEEDEEEDEEEEDEEEDEEEEWEEEEEEEEEEEGEENWHEEEEEDGGEQEEEEDSTEEDGEEVEEEEDSTEEDEEEIAATSDSVQIDAEDTFEDERVAGPSFIERLVQYRKKLLALAAILLITLLGSFMTSTDWWDYKSYTMSSTFQLKQLDGEWRLYKFGTVLLINGTMSNSTKVTKNVPKVRVSLFDDTNTLLESTSVIPGRIVKDNMLDNIGEASLRSMVSLQDDDKQEKGKKLWPDKEIGFQAIFIHPPEGATRYQIDFEEPGTQSSDAGIKMYGGKF